MIKMRVFWLLMILIVAVSYGCSLFQNEVIPIDENGTMMVQYEDTIYRIGGIDADGAISDAIYRSQIILSDDVIEFTPWVKDSLSLPEPRAYGAVLAVGGYLYIIGGEDQTGLVDSVYVTAIKKDGSLGYGTASPYWANQKLKLPEPRSHMAYEYIDGRIFLIGGKLKEGISNSIIHAKIHSGSSGQVGHWYTSPERLPVGRYDSSSALSNNTLYIGGGYSSNGLTDTIISYNVDVYGRLSTGDTIPSIPKTLTKPIMTVSENTLVMGGGYNSNGTVNEQGYFLEQMTWMPKESPIKGVGPFVGRANGSLIGKVPKLEDDFALASLNIAPITPLVTPGSGYVRLGEEIVLESRAWNTLVYEKDATVSSVLDISNTIYTEPFPILESSNYIFKNLNPSGESDTMEVTYIIKKIPIFLGIDGSLRIATSGEEGLETLSIASREAWYSLKIFMTKKFEIAWADQSISEQYTANAEIILFEEDFCTEVLDDLGYPVAEPSALDTGKSGLRNWQVTLDPGTYYLHIVDTDDNIGGTIGFKIIEVID